MTGSVQRAIKIYARIKPTYNSQNFPYEIIPHSRENTEVLQVSIKGGTTGEDGYVNNRPETHSFKFSKVFNSEVNQSIVFEDVAQPVVDSALLGYNGTIFAYGQTGSGKTFTMTGSRSNFDDRGIIPRTLSYIFKTFKEDPPSGTKIRAAFVSYLEIYNEGGYDLLHSSNLPGRLEDLGKVTLLEDGQQQMHLRNLSVHPINSEEEALQLLYLGDHNRTVAETPLNEASTRSHCIFTIHLNVRDVDSSIIRRSKLHLVDLAGSERISNQIVSGQLFSETRHINLALHYLEQVIVALGEANRQHIPYRNSMMTSVLRDSLGGNCMTSMIATISMDQKSIQESISTCRFSQRVALVTNAAMPNEELDPSLVISQLKLEIRKLKEMVSTSAVKPLKENSVPLTPEEVTVCSHLVERFLTDTDLNAILAVVPDMRMIQACFRLLKALVNNSSTGNISGKKSKQATPRSALNLPSGEKVQENDDLVKRINRRDVEIKVLMDMLRKEKFKRTASVEDLAKGQTSRLSNRIESLTPTYKKTEDNSEKPSRIVSSENLAIENSNTNDGEEEMDFPNLSEVKKEALASFLSSYEGQESLEETKQKLTRKREEVISLDNILKNNRANYDSIKKILEKSKRDKKGKEDAELKEALSSQERTVEMQKERLKVAKEQVFETQGRLKELYEKLMKDFETFWEKNGENLSYRNKNIRGYSIAGTLRKSEMESANVQNMWNVNQAIEEECALAELSGNKKQIRVEEKYEMKISTPRNTVPTPTFAVGPKSARIDEPVPIEDEDSNAIPLTGDAETDNEILNFFKERKKIFNKISNNSKDQVG